MGCGHEHARGSCCSFCVPSAALQPDGADAVRLASLALASATARRDTASPQRIAASLLARAAAAADAHRKSNRIRTLTRTTRRCAHHPRTEPPGRCGARCHRCARRNGHGTAVAEVVAAWWQCRNASAGAEARARRAPVRGRGVPMVHWRRARRTARGSPPRATPFPGSAHFRGGAPAGVPALPPRGRDYDCVDAMTDYAELHCLSNFSFLRGASHPAELVTRAHELGYRALALTDECSMAGVVRACEAVRALPTGSSLRLIVGAEFRCNDGLHLRVAGAGAARLRTDLPAHHPRAAARRQGPLRTRAGRPR